MGNEYKYYDFSLYNEKWKMLTNDWYDIRENKYLISESGKIFNLNTGNIMKQEMIPTSKGTVYARIRLCATNNVGYTKVLVHRMVALYFLDKNDDPERKTIVDHKDGNKSNNHFSNLEWVTPTENAIRAYKLGLCTTIGSKHHFVKYTDEQIHAMCQLLQMGNTAIQVTQILNTEDTSEYRNPLDNPDFNRLYAYIKKLKSRTFRKDIVLQYNF